MSKTEIPLTSDPDRRLFYNSKTGLVELTENDGKTLLFQDGDWTYRGKTDIPQETRDQIFETVKKGDRKSGEKRHLLKITKQPMAIIGMDMRKN